ncbi:hypothetical protein [Marinoscillum sp. MHG1-6]|uniref:hypothetical protein n=1 Tax=Marinoscillum sp. MHG1-6 TaxID=2959627 RepID=UPI002157FF7D|nr:hypothetical protein [Marinoscillum sp. MHG1-6]
MKRSRQNTTRIPVPFVGIFCLMLLIVGCDWQEDQCREDPVPQYFNLYIVDSASNPVIGDLGIYDPDSIEIWNSETGNDIPFQENLGGSFPGALAIYFDTEGDSSLYNIQLADTADVLEMTLKYATVQGNCGEIILLDKLLINGSQATETSDNYFRYTLN